MARSARGSCTPTVLSSGGSWKATGVMRTDRTAFSASRVAAGTDSRSSSDITPPLVRLRGLRISGFRVIEFLRHYGGDRCADKPKLALIDVGSGSMISLVQLECFIAVAEELHFGAAATRLKMTQPPLSRQIQQLERELSTRLFDRTSRRVALTQAGRALLPNARRLIDLAAKAVSDVRSVGEGAAGTVTIAYTAMAGQAVVP